MNPSLVVVFSPGKTGTKSLYATLAKYFRAVAPGQDIVHHTHWLTRGQARSLLTAFRWKPKHQVEGRAEQVSEVVERFHSSRDAVVFTPVRNPVSRIRSTLYYRAPDVLERCLVDGEMVATEGLCSLLRMAARTQAIKENGWWQEYRDIFGFRLKDVPEIADKGFAIRKVKGRTLVLLKVEQMDAIMPDVFRDLGWHADKVKMVRSNESPISAELRKAFEAVPFPHDLIGKAECFEDWAAAYPELR